MISVFTRHYLPESRLDDVDAYRGWREEGWLTVTPGETTDFEMIEADILSFCRDHRVVEAAFDPLQAAHLI